MLTPKTLATVVALCFAPLVAVAADAPSYQWKAEKDSLSLLAGEKVVYAYHFAAEEGYPYIHPVSLPGGPVMSALAPDDHPWHRGLWFSWKFLNGVNYWEFPRKGPHQPDGKTAVVGPAAIQTTEGMATVRLRLEYSKGQIVLAEERTLVGSLPRLDGSYTIDWASQFTARQDVVFERTPPQKASYGGYGGLGFRASKTMRDFQAIDSEGRMGRIQAHGQQARWMDFSGVFGGKDEKPTAAGVAIFDHPSNPRYPVRWYLSDNAGLPYFGPALLFAEPMTLKAGESFTIKYRVLVHPGRGDKAALEKEYQDFAKLDVAGPPKQSVGNVDPAAAGQTVNYSRLREPGIPPALLPLPPGAVEPAGWLRDWAVAAREGITGHLDEYHPVFHDAWKGEPINAPHAAKDGTGWPLEQCAYWLDGALRLGFVLHDEALIKKIRARLDPIVDGVNKADFGTSFIYWKKDYQPQGFDSWAHSQLGRALVALYQGSGDKRVLEALVKVYAAYPVKMGATRFFDVSGLCNLDAMLETYSLSGDQRILDRAVQAIAQPDVVKDIQAWGQGSLANGHMVITYEDIRLPGLMYPWTGDPGHLQATLHALGWLDEKHMLPYGVASGEEYASGIGACRKTETCNVAAAILALSWMYRIQGAGAYGDKLERAFYNAGAAPVARDFKTICYYQSPNRISDGTLPVESAAPGKGCLKFSRLGYPPVLCCVGAVNRIIPYFVMHMWMATRDNGLAAALYGPSKVSALVGPRVGVTITSQTGYPFEETIRLQVEPERTVTFPLYLRIPAWCRRARINVNGAPALVTADTSGFACLSRSWSKGDVVTLSLPMRPEVVCGYETEFPASVRQYFSYEPAAMFESRRLPYASVTYGPLLFSLAIPDKDPDTPAADARWQYALNVDRGRRGADIKVQSKPMPAHWDWPLDAPLSLEVPAQAFDWKPTNAQALPSGLVEGNQTETIRLVPYGCTKFRISMFPVTDKTLGKR